MDKLYGKISEKIRDGTAYYFHNAETLADSSIIYTFNAGGFAWTTDWNDGNPVWQYGITRDGNAVMNALSAYKVQADQIEAGSITVEKLSDEYKTALKTDLDSISASVFLHAEQMGKIEEKMTAVEQTAESVAIRVQKIEEDGVDKVVTSMGYTFDDTGLHIQKEGEEMDNTLDHTGMYVRRGDEVMLQANASGVQATDVTVRNYMIVGSHARFEDYNDGTDDKRTACFWI